MDYFSIMKIIPFIFVFVGLTLVIIIIFTFSSKARGKMMSKQVKAVRHMMDESKEDIESISNDYAEATKGAIKTGAKAFKEGFVEDSIFCKHCGETIDKDSKFCKKCGKEQ